MNAKFDSEWEHMAALTPPKDFIGNLAQALAKAQAEMSNPSFDSVNPHFRNHFASLAAVRNAVVPTLAKHGIAISQDLQSVEAGVSCTTILTHQSGQQMRFGPLVLPVSKNDAQGFGSAATYARRYSLMAVACVVGDDDDDSNAATGKVGSTAYAEPVKPQGDAVKSVGIDKAQETAMKMLAIIDKPAADGDHDEKYKALDALDFHDRVLSGDNDLYIAAAEQLPPVKRNAWKGLIKLARAQEKAQPF